MPWIRACSTDDIELEDVIRFNHASGVFAVYRSPEDQFFATEGFCTHERNCLAEGLVMGDIIECPKHNGRFNYKTGEGKGAPIITRLKTYATRVEGDDIFIDIG